jgi:hypothetical protein
MIRAAVLSGTIASVHASGSGPISPNLASTVKISITVQGKVVTATLADSPTTRDFVSLLPLTVTLSDHASTEKVTYLPRRLSTDGAPAGSDPSAGDIAYYAPWGNIAIFYKDFGYSGGLIKLGRIESGMDVLNVPGQMQATIELIDKD